MYELISIYRIRRLDRSNKLPPTLVGGSCFIYELISIYRVRRLDRFNQLPPTLVGGSNIRIILLALAKM